MTKTKLVILIISSSLFLGGYNYSPDNSFKTAFPTRDFLHMEGIRVSHVMENSSDSLSDNKIVELQDEKGLTIWFARYFHKDICITGICRMVKLWIFWDGVGNYLGIQLDEKDPLTKSDHSPFESQDYIRLDEILADTVSILKELQYEDLVVEDTLQLSVDDKSEKKLFEVDGYSSATLPSLKEYVIKDAVFTCYTLWHTVYGETKVRIDDLLNDKVDSRYIDKLLNGSENQKLFALEMVRRNNSFVFEFDSQLLPLIASQNKHISKKTLSVVTPHYLSSSESQLRFIELMDNSLPETKYEIIYKLQLIDNISNDAIILLIDKYITGKISVGGLNQILKIISKQMVTNKNILNNNEIESRLVQLSKHSDPYTANLTKNFLKSIR
ncbi:hypothetical protein [Petrimonas sulfuriphila]|uniref:hypothetical protein n=1 Tax=Petrimonas sulfuriphila TaxID=285070 RepID=UPI003EB761AC